jgi:hypothetical protein
MHHHRFRTVEQARRDEIAWDALVSGAYALREAEPIRTRHRSPYIFEQGTVADLAAMRPLAGVEPDPEAAAPAVCECGLPIHEDRGARDHLGNPQCLDCEMDTLSRESRYD